VRVGIIRTASRLGRPRLMVGVIKSLGDRHMKVRLAALQGLRLHPSRLASRAVADCLEDPFPQVRREAAVTLGILGSRNHLPALQKIAEDPTEVEGVRKAVLAAIEAIEARE
ncbi:MAG: HEAT repeat domain-containing protein, partial [Planctomycetota bacterium]